MRNKETKKTPQLQTFKGELVPEKDHTDFEPTGRYLKNNPLKTPPNNLTTKKT